MSRPVVFLDIAGPDAGTLSDFYSRVFGWEVDAHGQFMVTGPSPLPATFREDPAEKRLYIGVDDVSRALADVENQGGTIDQDRFEVPGVAVLALFKDPAGNPMGLVEMDGDALKTP